MILFIFEGDRECPVFETIRTLFLPKEIEPFICVYKSNIYSLYSKIKEYDLIGGQEEVDTLSVLDNILTCKGDNSLSGILASDISEIFLFFDYDFHHSRGTLEENNAHLKELLEYFDDETEHGKLYINYPMVESLRYTALLPDSNYPSYTVCRDDCRNFKRLASDFSAYKSFDHLIPSDNPKEAEEKRRHKFEEARRNWCHLIEMNVHKANHICNDSISYPRHKTDISQMRVFDAQIAKHVSAPVCRVSILNSFPIFIYDYLRENPAGGGG